MEQNFYLSSHGTTHLYNLFVDKRGVISDNSYYLLFLFLYIIYILIIIILAFIFIKNKELINIKAYSKLVEEKVREFINKFLDVAKRKYLNNKE